MLALKQDFKINNYELINYLNLEKNDSLFLLSVRNHPLIRKQMKNHNVISERDHFKFIENLRSENIGYWILKHENKFIGSISLVNIDFKKTSCVGGNFIDPNYIGTGLGLIINYFMHFLAFEKMSFDSMNAVIRKTNKNANKINDFFGAKSISLCDNDFFHVQFQKTQWEEEIKLKTSKLLKYANK
jgi:UDP-4-amino-4,6-dideoxy-N-acetyl-beta-L-altrosamine N-acetyltransferase